jgi:hypothetical protein
MVPPAPPRFSTTIGWPKRGRQRIEHDASDDVERRAGGERNHRSNGLRGPRLSAHDPRRRQRGSARRELQKSTARKCHDGPS